VPDNVEILKRAYQALNEGDINAALDVLEPDAEWSEQHSELPEASTYRGREAIRAFLESFLESWNEFKQETERLVDVGDRVAVLLLSTARGRGSGIEVERRYAHLWTMRNGKGTRVEAYADQEAALAALGPARASESARQDP
jgi:uncharacterized protein